MVFVKVQSIPIMKSWLKDPQFEITRLGCKYNNFEEVKKCSGIVFTGGNDVIIEHPERTMDKMSAFEKKHKEGFSKCSNEN